MRPRQVDGTHRTWGAKVSYHRDVSPARSRPPLPFDAKSIGTEIEEARVRLGVPVDDIYERIGLSSRTHWYSKVSGSKPFRWEEAAKVAVEFQAPPGWPIVSWREGLAWQAWLDEQEKAPRRDD